MTPAGLPHSDIRGSQDACSSPRLIAACHVLLRLSAPRHPPCALTALDQFRPVTRPPQLNAREPDHTPEPATPRSIYPRCLLPLHPNCQKARRRICVAASRERYYSRHRRQAPAYRVLEGSGAGFPLLVIRLLEGLRRRAAQASMRPPGEPPRGRRGRAPVRIARTHSEPLQPVKTGNDRTTMAKPTATCRVNRRGAARWRERLHPWIYRSDVIEPPRADAGDVLVLDERGAPVGMALWSPSSTIALRMLTQDERAIDEAFWRER